jgi:hypothetical protein
LQGMLAGDGRGHKAVSSRSPLSDSRYLVSYQRCSNHGRFRDDPCKAFHEVSVSPPACSASEAFLPFPKLIRNILWLFRLLCGSATARLHLISPSTERRPSGVSLSRAWRQCLAKDDIASCRHRNESRALGLISKHRVKSGTQHANCPKGFPGDVPARGCKKLRCPVRFKNEAPSEGGGLSLKQGAPFCAQMLQNKIGPMREGLKVCWPPIRNRAIHGSDRLTGGLLSFMTQAAAVERCKIPRNL